MTIGKLINSARTKCNMTQEELSKRTQLSRSYISDLENNRYSPSVKALSSIAKVLNMDLNFLTSMTEIQVKCKDQDNKTA